MILKAKKLPCIVKPVLLCLDYDGTLVPIVDDPQKALLDKNSLQMIHEISQTARLAIISARPVSFILQQLPVELSGSIILSGLYGYEMFYGNGIMRAKVTLFNKKTLLNNLKKLLSEKCIPHSVIEDKIYTIALHFRTCPSLERTLIELATQIAQTHNGEIRLGKMVVEIVPQNFPTKAKIVEKLSSAFQSVIYCGDDLSDAQAFQTLKARLDDKSYCVAVKSLNYYEKLSEYADITIKPEELKDTLTTLLESCNNFKD
jgi:trehalose 6-phosphate phosphatase